MSETEELSYDEPWPMYRGEDDPWKDFDRLLKLDEQMDTQKEMGAALGCTPSTISYWLDKARDEVEPEVDEEDLHCRYHEVCGNLKPGIGNTLCIVCLDLARHNQGQHPDWVDPVDFESREAHMESLYSEYPDYVETRQAAYDKRHKDSTSED